MGRSLKIKKYEARIKRTGIRSNIIRRCGKGLGRGGSIGAGVVAFFLAMGSII